MAVPVNIRTKKSVHDMSPTIHATHFFSLILTGGWVNGTPQVWKKSTSWITGTLIYTFLHDLLSHNWQVKDREQEEEKGKEKLEKLKSLIVLFYLTTSHPEHTSSSSSQAAIPCKNKLSEMVIMSLEELVKQKRLCYREVRNKMCCE